MCSAVARSTGCIPLIDLALNIGSTNLLDDLTFMKLPKFFEHLTKSGFFFKVDLFTLLEISHSWKEKQKLNWKEAVKQLRKAFPFGMINCFNSSHLQASLATTVTQLYPRGSELLNSPSFNQSSRPHLNKLLPLTAWMKSNLWLW